MQNEVPSIQSSRYPNRPKPDGAVAHHRPDDRNHLADHRAHRNDRVFDDLVDGPAEQAGELGRLFNLEFPGAGERQA